MYLIKVKKLGRLFYRTYQVNSHGFTNEVVVAGPDGKPMSTDVGPLRLELRLAAGGVVVYGDIAGIVLKLGKDFFNIQRNAAAEKAKQDAALDAARKAEQNKATAKPANAL